MRGKGKGLDPLLRDRIVAWVRYKTSIVEKMDGVRIGPREWHRRIGVHYSEMSRILNGELRSLGLETFVRLCSGLVMDPTTVLTEWPRGQEPSPRGQPSSRKSG